MEFKKSSATSWLVLGAACVLLLYVVGYLEVFAGIHLSFSTRSLISAVLGWGGAIFLIIGVYKFIVEKFRKQ